MGMFGEEFLISIMSRNRLARKFSKLILVVRSVDNRKYSRKLRDRFAFFHFFQDICELRLSSAKFFVRRARRRAQEELNKNGNSILFYKLISLNFTTPSCTRTLWILQQIWFEHPFLLRSEETHGLREFFWTIKCFIEKFIIYYKLKSK